MQNIRYVRAKKGKRGWDFQREGKSVERDERDERDEQVGRLNVYVC